MTRVDARMARAHVKRPFVAPVLVALACSSVAVVAQPVDYSKLEIEITDLGNGVHLLGWQGGDSLILAADDGVLLVDTSVAQMGDKIRAAVAKVSNRPIKVVINTHAHADHFGANEMMAKDGAVIVAHAKLHERMEKGQRIAVFNQTIPPSRPAALPTVTYDDALTLHFGGEAVQLFHVPNAHTDSDTLVHFKRANVIHASGTFGGDGSYPFFDMSSGGSLAGTIAAQEKMLSLADANTRIVPDEGVPGSTAMLRECHDALIAIRTRVQKLIDEGESEDEAVAAKPTQDLDVRWVRPGGFLTGDTFTRMAYQSLKRGSAAAAP
jgi:glyoxylase-like metal-dependent hydrolase (beta-lactamase superfamily II)